MLQKQSVFRPSYRFTNGFHFLNKSLHIVSVMILKLKSTIENEIFLV